MDNIEEYIACCNECRTKKPFGWRSIAANFKPHNKKRRKAISCAFRSNARLYILLLTHDHNRALACAGACAVEVDEVTVTRGADGELAVGNLEGLR